MTDYRTVEHSHPVFRVVRAAWKDPLDVSFSQRAAANRWNTPQFPALYCCCSDQVARAVTRAVLKIAGVELDELQPAYRPRLIEIGWEGEVVDVASAEGISSTGFSAAYPEGVGKDETRRRASEWHDEGAEGVLCRSASLWRLGFADWTGPHPRWGELAIYVENCRQRPEKTGERDDLAWLSPSREDARSSAPRSVRRTGAG